MRYKGIPTKEFIEQRDEKIAVDNNPNPDFRWDSEFPEFHQAEIDPKQTIYEGFEFDTIHEDLGNLDYKMYSQSGVHVSKYIQRQVAAGKIDKFVVWMWVKPWEKLKEGMPVEYEILGQVDAKEAVKKINEENRFTFPL